MQSIISYLSDIDNIYGVFLDANRGFDLIKDDCEKINRGVSDEMLKKRKNLYGVGDPNSTESYPLHVVNQYDYLQRNLKNGKNRFMLANQSVVQIYQYWEDMYREEIARNMGICKNDLKVDVFGDLRIIRQSIIHNHGIATSDITKCKILKWFNQKQVIEIDSKMFEKIVFESKGSLKKLAGLGSV